MKIPIIIEENAGIDRMREPVRVGVPFSQGARSMPMLLRCATKTAGCCRCKPRCSIVGRIEAAVGCWWIFKRPLAPRNGQVILELQDGPVPPHTDELIVTETAETIEVVTGPETFRLSKHGPFPFKEVIANGQQILHPDSPGMVVWSMKTAGPGKRKFLRSI